MSVRGIFERELLARVSIVHDFEAALLVAASSQGLGNGFNGHIRKWRGITFIPGHGTDLSQQTFNQVANGHTRGNGVRVNYNVRGYSLRGEGHVLLAVRDPDGSL